MGDPNQARANAPLTALRFAPVKLGTGGAHNSRRSPPRKLHGGLLIEGVIQIMSGRAAARPYKENTWVFMERLGDPNARGRITIRPYKEITFWVME